MKRKWSQQAHAHKAHIYTTYRLWALPAATSLSLLWLGGVTLDVHMWADWIPPAAQTLGLPRDPTFQHWQCPPATALLQLLVQTITHPLNQSHCPGPTASTPLAHPQATAIVHQLLQLEFAAGTPMWAAVAVLEWKGLVKPGFLAGATQPFRATFSRFQNNLIDSIFFPSYVKSEFPYSGHAQNKAQTTLCLLFHMLMFTHNARRTSVLIKAGLWPFSSLFVSFFIFYCSAIYLMFHWITNRKTSQQWWINTREGVGWFFARLFLETEKSFN